MFKRWSNKSKNKDAFEAELHEQFDLLYRVALPIDAKYPRGGRSLSGSHLISVARSRRIYSGTSMRAWLLKILNNQFIDVKRKVSDVNAMTLK